VEPYSNGISSPITPQICTWKAMDLSFQGEKTEHVYLVWFKFYCMGNTKKLVKIKKSLCTVKRTVKKIYMFLQISQEPVKKGHKDKCKNKVTALKNKNNEKHAYLGSQ
jgi:hypothetical protein